MSERTIGHCVCPIEHEILEKGIDQTHRTVTQENIHHAETTAYPTIALAHLAVRRLDDARAYGGLVSRGGYTPLG